jgi:RND family efflux transporter MFP subunit
MGTPTLPFIQRRVLQGAVALCVVAVIGLAFYFGFRNSAVHANDRERQHSAEVAEADAISVKTVRPTIDPHYQITVSRPADVQAYYSGETGGTDIEARVAGKVKTIKVAAGSHVEKDQLLLTIAVPDLDAEEKTKENFVRQRDREVHLAQAKVEAANAAVNTALANVEEKKTLLRQAKAVTTFRSLYFDRMEALLAKNAIDKNVRDEAQKDLEVARAAEIASEAARIKAESEVEDARANVKCAEAEVARARELVEVARADAEKARALANFAKVKAPYRGTVVRRKVDPGSFVQNASTGHPTPLLCLQRTDIVSVVMRVPDTYAPFVSSQTEAIIELDSLPGLKIHGRVTRFPRSLVTAAHDRTMPVEVDLWNGSPEEYKQFVANPENLTDLKEGPLPILPEFTGKDSLERSHALMPGMYAHMTLVLKDFGRTALIPSNAVVRRGGRAYLFVVRDGKAHLMPVQLQMDDGNLAKVVRLRDNGKVAGELSADEQIIVSNQEELTEGQAVSAVPANAGAENSQ